MNSRWICLGLCLAAMILACGASTAQAATLRERWQQGAAYRASIRQMPLVERPNRPIHVYGNTVRFFSSR
ncbi:MAG: hypothetical protein J5I93_11685 [Pirellulaceae bacterium]|nr:hypothetical protein [Pirellulaceae bacterium]